MIDSSGAYIAPAPQRTYAQWLVLAVSIGREYGIGSRQWNELGEAAAAQLSFRVWALKFEAGLLVKGLQT